MPPELSPVPNDDWVQVVYCNVLPKATQTVSPGPTEPNILLS